MYENKQNVKLSFLQPPHCAASKVLEAFSLWNSADLSLTGFIIKTLKDKEEWNSAEEEDVRPTARCMLSLGSLVMFNPGYFQISVICNLWSVEAVNRGAIPHGGAWNYVGNICVYQWFEAVQAFGGGRAKNINILQCWRLSPPWRTDPPQTSVALQSRNTGR